MRKPQPYHGSSGVTQPGLYHCLESDRYELWVRRGESLYCEGWILATSFGDDDGRMSSFLAQWMRDSGHPELARGYDHYVNPKAR